MDAIILVGGLGTRLREHVPNVAKSLAPVKGRPFLDFLLDQLKGYRVILAVGHLADQYKFYYQGHGFIFSEDSVPLGTGGAVKKAFKLAKSENVFVLNGDTFFNVDLGKMIHFHLEKKADLTIGCKKMEDGSRYGTIKMDSKLAIVGFEEKKSAKESWINGGIYIMKKNLLDAFPDIPFSLENEAFPLLLKKEVFAYISNATFLDIGTKESYLEAEKIL